MALIDSPQVMSTEYLAAARGVWRVYDPKGGADRACMVFDHATGHRPVRIA